MIEYLEKLIELAIEEDIGSGDITTDAVISKDLRGKAVFKAKQDLVLAGIDLVEAVFLKIDDELVFKTEFSDGEGVSCGNIIATVEGKVSSILTAERIALNFLQRLTGIATYTNKFVTMIKDCNTKILDTRKTTPGYRMLEKYAVAVGGANNHRIGLYDQYLIKDNHIDAAGSISDAVEKTKIHRHNNRTKIEVEAKNLEEVKEAIDCDVDIIMLDNMSIDKIKAAMKLKKGDVKFEVSGNVTLDNIAEYAATGIDYISVGAITHSAPAADISMLLESQ